MQKNKSKLRSLSDVTDTLLKEKNLKKNNNSIDNDLNLARNRTTLISEDLIKDTDLPNLKLESIIDKNSPKESENLSNLNIKKLVVKKTQRISKKEKQISIKTNVKDALEQIDNSRSENVNSENLALNSKNLPSKKSSKPKEKMNSKALDDVNNNLKKITILIDEESIHQKALKLHEQALSSSFLKIKRKRSLSKQLSSKNALINNSNEILKSNNLLNTSELITYNQNNYSKFANEVYPISQDNIEMLSVDRKSSNYKEFSNLKNFNEIEKEKLNLLKKKYELKKEIKNLIDDSSDINLKNKFLIEKIFLDPIKKKEVLKLVLLESKVNTNYDSLRHQIGKLTIYLENLKTLLSDVEFDINMNNVDINEGCQIIHSLESKIYVTQSFLYKIRNRN